MGRRWWRMGSTRGRCPGSTWHARRCDRVSRAATPTQRCVYKGEHERSPRTNAQQLVAKAKATLWPMDGHTAAKHAILRKYLDAWLPILGGGRYAHDHLVLIDGFAGPGRYATGQD